MDNNKSDTREMIHLLSSRMHSGFVSYHIWKWLEQSRNINIGNEFVEKNLKILNRQPNFFHTVLRNSFYGFIIDLCMFFDKQAPSLSIDKIIDKINLSPDEILKICTIRDSQNYQLKKLKDIRDKEVAHLDLNIDRTTTNTVLYTDIEKLFASVQEIFNIVTNNFDSSIWTWPHIEPAVKREMELIFNNLERGENIRIEEINRKWEI